ncbi:MAG: hypothetical protein HQ551_13120 [Desulfobacteraceae bacterium]|nr:hypothetical protein [Desulfobacteraceae bacterium]
MAGSIGTEEIKKNESLRRLFREGYHVATDLSDWKVIIEDNVPSRERDNTLQQ